MDVQGDPVTREETWQALGELTTLVRDLPIDDDGVAFVKLEGSVQAYRDLRDTEERLERGDSVNAREEQRARDRRNRREE